MTELVLNFLKTARLRQYPPATRSVLVWGRPPVRFRFPWMTFGGLRIFSQDMTMTALVPLAFIHKRPWTSLEDALGVLQFLPYGFHMEGSFAGGISGKFCPGAKAGALIATGAISVEDAFWLTRNRDLKNYSFIQSLLDFDCSDHPWGCLMTNAWLRIVRLAPLETRPE